MEFNKLAKSRYSCRKFSSRKIDKDTLLQVLEAGRIAPSAVNYQPWHFIVFDEEPYLSGIKECYHREWLRTAPIVILLCSDHNKSWKRSDGKDHADIDIAIATDHMTLAATNLGLATCWVCNFDPVKIMKLLNLPKHIEPIVMLPLGYPEDECDINRHLSKRKPLDEIVFFNSFNENSY
ncbi:MAG: nitroreductase family protein [Bacteroidales bacterium]|nr:nitroreductase family protein [Bacteroidales bacterium]